MNEKGDTAIFTKTVCDEENNTYKNNIYVWKDGITKALTSSGKDTNAFFLDNDTVLFRSSRCKNDEEKMKNGEELTSFYTISLDGGEAQKYFSVPLYVSSIKQVCKDVFIFSASYDVDYSVYGREDEKDALLKAKKEDADYEVFTKIPFCHNGGGYAKNTITRLYKYNVKEDAITLSSIIS